MESIISTFHIDWRLIAAQVVNFAIVVAVLWFFALKPLVAKMTERTKTIDQSLRDAQTIAVNLKASEAEKNAIVAAARAESQAIIEAARQSAKTEGAETLRQAREQVQKIVLDGKRQIASEKDTMLEEIKKETSELVIKATHKILEQVVDKKIDQGLVKKTLDRLHE